MDIEGITPATARAKEPAKRPSIVMLPFDNMSCGPEQGRARDRPDLTMEVYRTIFPHPAWPEWFQKSRNDLETLVGLGLARE